MIQRYKSQRSRFCSKQTECSCHNVQECYTNGNQETGREKKVQTEEEKVNEFEDTLKHIICRKAIAENKTEEELTEQLAFVTTIRSHDPRAMKLLNIDA